MHQEKWAQVQNICLKFKIKPIIAVIPQNKDPSLMHSEVDRKFWLNLKGKQEDLGWTVGLHGFEHHLRFSSKGMVPINSYSEFTDVPLGAQIKMIKNGLSILSNHNIKPTVWVAPAHGFDKNTLIALQKASDISIISDGLSMRPYTKYNFNWIPQQLWKGRKIICGIWTICLHPNKMTDNQIDALERFVKNNLDNIISVEDVSFKKFGLQDQLFGLVFLLILNAKKLKINLCNRVFGKKS